MFQTMNHFFLVFSQIVLYFSSVSLKEFEYPHEILYPNSNPVTITPITTAVELAEGPYWCSKTQQLYFVDIPQGKVYKLNTRTGRLISYSVCDGPVGFVIGVQNTIDHFVIGCGRNLSLIQLDENHARLKSQVQTLATVDTDRSDTRFNDAKVDSVGRLWGGTMGPEINLVVTKNRGSLYSIDSKLIPNKRVSPVTVSNGITWNKDDSKMYYIDSPTRKIIAFAFDADSGSIDSPEVVFDFDQYNLTGIPDGMTIDTNDNLWVANHGGARVLNIDPRQRKLLRIIPIPVSLVTSVTFGGRLLDTLYVTTATLNHTELNGGSVFSVKGLGVRGFIPNEFRLKYLSE